MAKEDSTRCPECGEMVDVEQDSEVGDIIYCPYCDVELKIVKLDPPRLRLAEDLGNEEHGGEFGQDVSEDET